MDMGRKRLKQIIIIILVTTIIIIQFNSFLFTCNLNSPEDNHEVSVLRRKKQKRTNKIQIKGTYTIQLSSIQLNSIH